MIKLAVRTQGGWHGFTVEFANEGQALWYIQTRGSDRVIEEMEDHPLPNHYVRLINALYPLCEHQMSASLCMGPNHYPTAEQERALWG